MNTYFKKSVGILLIWMIVIPPDITRSASPKIVYPLQEVSKLECRMQKFWDLDNSCKENLKILKTSDYKTYARMDRWYNDYTRRYSVLWWASYTYWWDVWNWWHMWVDIATAQWTPVYAMSDWEVIVADKKLDFWNLVSIKHKINWKPIVTNYAHLSKIDVSVWEKVTAWQKIGEVWSTWNSTWNHLHFQIDLKVWKNPAYYSYDTCPYWYYDIVENWKCFQELKTLTIDPLAFLETSWAIMDNIKVETVSRPTKNSTNTTSNTISSNSNIWSYNKIFDKQIYIWSAFDDVVEVQKIYRNLWYYDWKIDWDYTSVLASVIKYQIDKKIVTSFDDSWAWHFWPKTRSQTKKDYEIYLAKNSISNKKDTEISSSSEMQNISREWMLTREEIEARELKEFENRYDIKINNNNDVWNNISIWTNKTISLDIMHKNGRAFVWNTPQPITFNYDKSLISVFPEKFYNYTDWKRDIIITWIKSWEVNLEIKIWDQLLDIIKLRVLSKKQEKNLKVKDAVTLISPKIVLWEVNLWAIMLKDTDWHRLINLRYNWNYELKVEWEWELCIKNWNLIDAKKIVKQSCDQFAKSKKFTYDDTVWGLIIFDYRIFDKNAKIKLYSHNTKNDLVIANIVTNPPKWLNENYEYYGEIVKMLENSSLSFNIKQWYFLENRNLTDKEANDWIENTLYTMKKRTWDNKMKNKIESNIALIKQEKWLTSKNITRKELLDKVYKYLVFDKNPKISISYKDLPESDNIKANTVFDSNNTWKDRFWEDYYRPTQTITRWEWAFLLAKAYDRTNVLNVVYAN